MPVIRWSQVRAGPRAENAKQQDSERSDAHCRLSAMQAGRDARGSAREGSSDVRLQPDNTCQRERPMSGRFGPQIYAESLSWPDSSKYSMHS